MQGKAEQLRMFMPVSEIIDTVHKVDSAHPEWTPHDQWNKPGAQHFSLKDVKLGAAKTKRIMGDKLGDPKSLKDEVAGGRSKPLGIYSRPGRQPTLADGHHRLALHEHLGHQFAAVEYRNKPQWGDLPKGYKNDRS